MSGWGVYKPDHWRGRRRCWRRSSSLWCFLDWLRCWLVVLGWCLGLMGMLFLTGLTGPLF